MRLNIVLPPLLYSAALDVSFVGFKRSLPQIRRLGIWLVLLTAVAAGLVAWLIFPALTLPGALMLGAIVAPPDAVSAAAIGRKLGLPRRIMTVLSGESLVNDATSLTLYRVFAAIVAGATLTVWDGVCSSRWPSCSASSSGWYVGFNAPRTDYTTRQQEARLWLSAASTSGPVRPMTCCFGACGEVHLGDPRADVGVHIPLDSRFAGPAPLLRSSHVQTRISIEWLRAHRRSGGAEVP
ncbi:cation:proton antiporter domain-containing protein [Microbacterium tenebrionis]|uniref:cation:proton antiporter domain-containing protein n=1 Tax=Microbacterium tenebrionis TaxID=2830665 RepID=UPI001D0D7B41|nr:cation:proton antiporter [Microbacterium tenebrionis]